jgi:hypothetical protein
MKLVCTNGMHAHWGSQFTKGKEYDFVVGSVHEKSASLIIDWKKYHESVYNGDINSDLWRKYIKVTWVTAKGDDGKHTFVLQSRAELMKLYGVKEVYFYYTTHLLEDYFDYKSVKRNQILADLGIL